MARSGAHALGLLAVPLNSRLLRSLSTGPKRQVELRRESALPALSTLRSHLCTLEGIGVVVKRRRNAFPGSLEYELGEAGKELTFVMKILERWLRRAPGEPLELGSSEAKATVKALVEGWSSTIVRALAAGPRSLTELDRLISAYNYPSLERRLGAMRMAGLVAPTDRSNNGTPYVITDWLRSGVGPLVAASRWERRNQPADTARIGRIDAEAALMLAVPLLRLPESISRAPAGWWSNSRTAAAADPPRSRWRRAGTRHPLRASQTASTPAPGPRARPAPGSAPGSKPTPTTSSSAATAVSPERSSRAYMIALFDPPSN